MFLIIFIFWKLCKLVVGGFFIDQYLWLKNYNSLKPKESLDKSNPCNLLSCFSVFSCCWTCTCYYYAYSHWLVKDLLHTIYCLGFGASILSSLVYGFFPKVSVDWPLLNISFQLQELYVNIGWPLYWKYGHAFEVKELTTFLRCVFQVCNWRSEVLYCFHSCWL